MAKHEMVNEVNFDVTDASWYKAAPLHERIRSLKQKGNLFKVGDDLNLSVDEWRFDRWKEQFRDNSEYFAQRLALDNISENELLALLNAPAESIQKRFLEIPKWLENTRQAFLRLSKKYDSFLQKQSPSEDAAAEDAAATAQNADFLILFESFIELGVQRIREGIKSICDDMMTIPFDTDHPERYFLPGLLQRLYMAVNRAMTLEVNIARVQGVLKGETSEERFQHFIQRLRQPANALAFLQEYPVLTRCVNTCIDQWMTNSLLFLKRLCTDWNALCSVFSQGKEPGVLKQVEGDAGDSHQGGQSVMILTFTSGMRLVYKPRSLNVDLHFQDLLRWLNVHGDHPPFAILRILNCEEYGWVEFVAMRNCSSQEEVQRFYQRQGAYLALLYMLSATDFHYENLIAAGEHPILVDLESLFHPRLDDLLTGGDEDVLAGDALAKSVMRVMLLPQRAFVNQEFEGLEMSGLGGAAGQLTPYQVMHMEDINKDTLHFVWKHVEMPGGRNRPQLNGEFVDAQEYTDEIVSGFTSMYRLLMSYRPVFLENDGPLAPFMEDQVRVILRPTYVYSRLIQDSYHPDVLRDALDRDMLFDRLWRDVKNRPLLSKVIASEYADLQRGDVPFFTTRIDSRHLWNSFGEQISDFFDCSGMDLVCDCLSRLSEKDLEKQIWFIRGSLTSLSVGTHKLFWPVYSLSDETRPATHNRLLEAAQAVGDRLVEHALRGENNTTWIGLSLIEERNWYMMPLGMDLYNGLPGVVLFLAYLGKVSGKESYTLLARSALTTLRKQVQRFGSLITTIGAFSGWGGMIYLYSHLAALWQEESFFDEAQQIISTIQSLIEKDEFYDVVTGAAGCIGSLLSLYQLAPSQQVVTILQQCGDHLLAHTRPMPSGTGWETLKDSQPLTGYSHGVAGIAWALLKLAHVTGQERFRSTALDAIAYERSLFSPSERNWPDLRDFIVKSNSSSEHSYMSTWCHGASGIALARLDSLGCMDDEDTRNEIDIALETTLAHGFGQNHSLCHGDLGNIQTLCHASSIYHNDYTTHVARLASSILASIEKYGWLCGVPRGIETPGLMVGLAGIGYGLLRLAEPEIVPDVLLLAPPIQRH